MASLSDVVAEADQTKVDQILADVNDLHYDPDYRVMVVAMLEEGLSPYAAARRASLAGLSERSLSVLYHHARRLAKELREDLGAGVAAFIDKLGIDGEVVVPLHRLTDVRREANELGWSIEVEVKVRLA
jgi:hypothetical protein